MTAGKFYRPKAAAVVSAFENTRGPSSFSAKTKPKQGGPMFTTAALMLTPKHLVAQKQAIVYSKARVTR